MLKQKSGLRTEPESYRSWRATEVREQQNLEGCAGRISMGVSAGVRQMQKLDIEFNPAFGRARLQLYLLPYSTQPFHVADIYIVRAGQIHQPDNALPTILGHLHIPQVSRTAQQNHRRPYFPFRMRRQRTRGPGSQAMSPSLAKGQSVQRPAVWTPPGSATAKVRSGASMMSLAPNTAPDR